MRGYSRFQARRSPKWLLWLKPAVGAVDGLRVALDRVVIALAELVQEIAHLVHPAALIEHTPRVDDWIAAANPGTAVGYDQQQVLASQSAAIGDPRAALPGLLALSWLRREPSSLARPAASHP
jgi:hypothetical protein